MKSIFKITFLSILFLTSACSVEPITPEDPFSAGFQDTLQQVGFAVGLTQWNRSTDSQGKQNRTQLFLSDNSFKKVNVQTYTGRFPDSNGGPSGNENVTFTTYNNEIVTKYAIEGTLEIKDTFVLTEARSTKNIATEMRDKGFDTIYRMVIQQENTWASSKVGGSGTWKNTVHTGVTEYYLVKKVSNQLQMIRIYYKDNAYYIVNSIEATLNNIHLSYTL